VCVSVGGGVIRFSGIKVFQSFSFRRKFCLFETQFVCTVHMIYGGWSVGGMAMDREDAAYIIQKPKNRVDK